MPAERRTVPVVVLRAAVVRHVELSSLRRVAHDIGMSPSGLFSFLRSADRRPPQARTYQKLLTWLVRTRREDTPGPSTDAAEAGITILVQSLPQAKRASAVREILNVIGASAEGERPPQWFRELRARYPTRREKAGRRTK